MEKYHVNKTPRDAEYVEAYLKYGSQNIAAKACNVGRETIARAVRRAGIKLTGRNRNGENNAAKITDEELRTESLNMDAVSIAKTHKMSVDRVVKRANKLGIKLNTKDTGGHWKRRARFYGTVEIDESITLKDVRQKFNDICQICGEKVNDNDIENGHIKRLYPTVDHIIPLSKGGTHTWNNVQLAHMCCNAGKCNY